MKLAFFGGIHANLPACPGGVAGPLVEVPALLLLVNVAQWLRKRLYTSREAKEKVMG